AASLGERCQARLRLVDIETVVQPARSGALVREPQSDVAKLTLEREVELMNTAVMGVGGKSADALGRDTGGSCRKGVWKPEQRLPAVQGIENRFAELVGAHPVGGGVAPVRRGVDAVTAADDETGANPVPAPRRGTKLRSEGLCFACPVTILIWLVGY